MITSSRKLNLFFYFAKLMPVHNGIVGAVKKTTHGTNE
jgi:hypothetical protein